MVAKTVQLVIAAHLFILLIDLIYFLVINCYFLFYYFIIYLPIYFCSGSSREYFLNEN